MAEAHGDVSSVAARLPVLNASLLYVNQYLDDVVGPCVDQSTANLRLADQQVVDCEENVENVARTRNASLFALTS